MDYGIKGKAVLITGAGGGIGSATARLFADSGCSVAIFDRNQAAADDVAAEIRDAGGSVLSGPVDVRSFEDVQKAVARTVAEFGGLDFYVSVAGGGTRETIDSMSIDDWHAVLDLNLTGPFNGIKAAAPAIRKRGGGAIVTVGSLAGITMSMNNGVSYTAGKSGVLGLTRHAAFELASDGIRVNAVLPGPVLTGQMKAKISPETLVGVPQKIPLGRWVEPEEIAAPILFFCSTMSSACTGTHVVIDGGLHIGAPMSREAYVAWRTKV